MAMSKMIAAALAGAVVLALPWAAQAEPKKKKFVKRPPQQAGETYAGSTARQRSNSRAYDRGEYYEQMSEAHVFGSRSWWYLKEREMGGNQN
jgi:predicted outer membrane protein